MSFHSNVRFSARHKCFGNVIFMIKSRCKFFCLVITQKANFLEQFEVWFFFLKIRFFPKMLKIWKVWKILFFLDFSWKIRYSKASTVMNLKDIRILKIPRMYRIDQRISYWKHFWLARSSWRAQVEYSIIEVRARQNSKSSILSFYGRIFYLCAPRNARAPKLFSAWYSLMNSIYPRYFQNSYIF